MIRKLRVPVATKAEQRRTFLKRQEVAPRQKVHVLGHAIDAAKIATVGDRNAKIGDRPAKRIDKQRRLNWGVDVHLLNIVTRPRKIKAPSGAPFPLAALAGEGGPP